MTSSIAGIILAGGKGKRLNSTEVNKVVYPFWGKPMILYGVELLEGICSQIVVVVGAFGQSVKDTLPDRENLIFAEQEEQLGTAHATKVGLASLSSNPPQFVIVGMGDHMMYYQPKTITDLVALCKKESAAISFVTTLYDKPEELAWGHIERDLDGRVLDIIEHKDANEAQKKIQETNAGLYCFEYTFLRSHIDEIQKSEVTGEYYLTDMVKIALSQKVPVATLQVPFEEVGIGVNRAEELVESQEYYKKTR